MSFVRAHDVDVHYVEHGPADAAHTIVLLHGFTPDHRLMTGCFEPVFAGRDQWRRIYLDLPGMGETKAPATLRGTDDVFAVVRATIDALVPGPYAIAGESYGGYLARGLVAAQPERVSGMALVCPLLVPDFDRRDLPAHVTLVAEVDGDDAFAELAVVRTEQTYRRFLDDVAPGLAVADGDALARIFEGYAGSLEPELRPFPAPVLVVTGRQDSMTGYRDAYPILESYPRATLAVLDRAGHNAQYEQPALFNALVAEWLDRVEEAGRPAR